MHPIENLFEEANTEYLATDYKILLAGKAKHILYYYEMSKETFEKLKALDIHAWVHSQDSILNVGNKFRFDIEGLATKTKSARLLYFPKEIQEKSMGALKYESYLGAISITCIERSELPLGKAILRKHLVKD